MLVLIVLDGTLNKYFSGKDRQALLDSIGKRFITSNIKCPPDKTKVEWNEYKIKNNSEVSFFRDIALLYEDKVNQQVFNMNNPDVKKSAERNNIALTFPAVGVINVQ